MTTNTPYLNLVLYNSSTDQAATFATFRADVAGVATSSNFYKIDTAFNGLDTRITALETGKAAIITNASYVSANYYEATVSSITAYDTGISIALKLDTDSAGTVTLNINALGTKSVMKVNASGTPINIAGGELQAGRYYLFIYDGTRWVWVDASSADQVYHGGTTGNLVKVASDGSISDSATPSSVISGTINAATSKTTPVDADEFGGTDSAASYVLKKFTWANIKATLKSYFDGINDGWIPSSATWSYSSVDSPTGIISVNADMTAILQKGMRVSYEQSQALSAYWSFDTDSSAGVGSFTMADVGTPTYTAGKFSNALTLDGSTDALSITDVATLKPTGDFTVGAWFKTSTTGVTQSIFASYSANTSLAGITLRITTGNVLALLIGKNTGTTLNSDYSLISGATTVTDGNWHYAVATFKNNFVQLYLDGELEVSSYSLSPAYAATNYIRIGCMNNTGTNLNFFNGQIDDLFFINGYALDEITIRTKYRTSTAQGTGNITVSKKGIITNVGAYSASATLITVYHGTDFMLANSTISNPRYSNMKSPFGFPSETEKWSVIVTDPVDRTISTPVATTWYGQTNTFTGGSTSIPISVPIGKWTISFTAPIRGAVSSGTEVGVHACLSTSLSAPSLPDELNGFGYTKTPTGDIGFYHTIYREKFISLSSKTSYYPLIKSNQSPTTIGYYGATVTPVKLVAVCAYL